MLSSGNVESVTVRSNIIAQAEPGHLYNDIAAVRAFAPISKAYFTASSISQQTTPHSVEAAMPVLNRRPQVLAPHQGGSARNSTESSEGMKDQLWIVDEDYEKPQKEMDFPSAKLGKMPARPKSRNALRLNTYTEQDMHDRYLSSEEEPSPSPDDGGDNGEEELQQIAAEILVDDSLDASLEEFKAEIAIAVPILAFGRPKLIDITNLAPMHKRKRTAKPLLPHPVSKPATAAASAAASAAAPAAPPTVVDENRPPQAHDAPAELTAPAPSTRQQLKRKESFSMSAPASWLPEDPLAEEEDERDDFPNLNTRSNAGYRHEYEPLSFGLEAPRRMSNRSLHHFSTRVLETNSHNPPSPSLHTALTPTSGGGTALGWKGLTRSLSLKRNSGSHQVSKKPKMIPRGANEREASPVIPPFPFESEVAVAS